MQGQLLKDAEIKSLQAQVNPHFFFNAINTISALVKLIAKSTTFTDSTQSVLPL